MVLDLHLARLHLLLQGVTAGRLELPAERAHEVLVDGDLDRRGGRSGRYGVPADRAGGRGAGLAGRVAATTARRSRSPARSRAPATPTAVTTSVRRRRSCRSWAARISAARDAAACDSARRVAVDFFLDIVVLSSLVDRAAQAGSSRLSVAHGVRGRRTSQALEQQQADVAGDLPRVLRRPRSRRVPPLPRSSRTRSTGRAAQAEAMPTTNATSSSADTAAATRVSRPSSRQRPTRISRTGRACPTTGTTRLGQQLVGADGPDVLVGVGQLQGAGDDPDAARRASRASSPAPTPNTIHAIHCRKPV